MRVQLIETAMRQFGELGFDGASTRDIAAETGTTMSNITYHFGSKEGLFLAASEAIAQRIGQVVGQAPVDPLPNNAHDNERLDLICGLLKHIASFMLSDQAAPMARFVAREQQNPHSHMRKFMARELSPVFNVIAREIAILRSDLSSEECRSSVFFLLGMAVSLRSSRLSLCIMMDVEDVGAQLEDVLLKRLDGMARGAIIGGDR